MSNMVLSRHNRNIRPVSNSRMVDEMLEILISLPPQEQWSLPRMDDQRLGVVCLFRHPKFPSKVLEYVKGSQEDSITSLYEDSTTFASVSELSKVRGDLIDEIGAVLMSLPSTVRVKDDGRGRKVELREMGTAQLMDTLAMYTRTDLKSA